jgi:pyruvate-formate lyase-activating enzyme
MKKNRIITENEKEQLIQKALRTTGYVSPETPEEVKEFEKKFGNTDVIFPEGLSDLKFLDAKKPAKVVGIKMKEVSDNLAMAAREGSSLPDEILKKMKEHRKEAKKKK